MYRDVYSLICNYQGKTESQVIVMVDMNILSTMRTTALSVVDENEKGNASLCKSCAEKRDLQKLNNLHTEISEDETPHSFPTKKQIEILQRDVMEAKRSLCQQKYQLLQADVKDIKKEEIILGTILRAI